jgi:hypothetical protein
MYTQTIFSPLVNAYCPPCACFFIFGHVGKPLTARSHKIYYLLFLGATKGQVDGFIISRCIVRLICWHDAMTDEEQHWLLISSLLFQSMLLACALMMAVLLQTLLLR